MIVTLVLLGEVLERRARRRTGAAIGELLSLVGIGRGAKEGVLIKNVEVLETLEKVDTVVVDKTGTLTEGRPRLTECVPASPFAKEDLLRYAASLERNSEHPLARAIVGRDAAGAGRRLRPQATVRPHDRHRL